MAVAVACRGCRIRTHIRIRRYLKLGLGPGPQPHKEWVGPQLLKRTETRFSRQLPL
jgi:hypothetical protein